MGRKYFGARKYIFFYIASLILSSAYGCATFKDLETRKNARRGLEASQRLMEEGKFIDALSENRRVLFMTGNRAPGDRALFNMGLIYAHAHNPGRDLEKSREYFTEIIHKFPESALAGQARVWTGIFDVIDILKKENVQTEVTAAGLEKQVIDLKHLIESRKLLAQGDYKKAEKESQAVLTREGTVTMGDEALFTMGLIYAHYDNSAKDFKISGDYFRRLIEEYPQSPLAEQAKIWQGVLDIIEQSKQVDIEIEKKKKELAR